MTSKNTICLWYERAALDAAKCYAETFPDSAVGTIYRAPGDYPAGKQQKNGVKSCRKMGSSLAISHSGKNASGQRETAFQSAGIVIGVF